MQMCPASFWHQYSYADFIRKSFYYYRNKDDEYKGKWEQVRKLAHINALVAGAKVEPQDVMAFPWDKEARRKIDKPMNKKEIEDTLNFYKQNGMLN